MWVDAARGIAVRALPRGQETMARAEGTAARAEAMEGGEVMVAVGERPMEITAELVRGLLRDQHPDLAELPVRLGARGWDNQLWRLGEDLAVRLPWATGDADELLRKEYAWMPALGPRLPLPVPVPQRWGYAVGAVPAAVGGDDVGAGYARRSGARHLWGGRLGPVPDRASPARAEWCAGGPGTGWAAGRAGRPVR